MVMDMTTKTDGFHLVPFAPDGEFLGKGYWKFESLSAPWIEKAQDFLAKHGEKFRAKWDKGLSRIETKLTSTSGAGLGTFYFDQVPVISTMYLSGISKEIEKEVIAVFLKSMKRVEYVQLATALSEPFAVLKHFEDRPLCAVIVWQTSNISDEDMDTIRELSNHFAAAYFLRHLPFSSAP